ncbi:hypothetical protein BDR04DRAFT_1000987, partial [Suillus decipiens]
IGSSMWALLSSFQNLWCSRQENDESDPGVVHCSTCLSSYDSTYSQLPLQ